MSGPSGFQHSQRKDGSVLITHHGKKAAILRGRAADRFIARLGNDDQALMARATGNYKRGNERHR
jgi:hypothetical protein